MATQAGILRHPPVAWLDLDRLGKVARREGKGMEKTIVGLGDPFTDRMGGKMAVITRGDMLVTGVLPRIVMILHDVAIRTCSGIIGHVGCTLSVTEGERTHSGQDAKQQRKGDMKEPNLHKEPLVPGQLGSLRRILRSWNLILQGLTSIQSCHTDGILGDELERCKGIRDKIVFM